MEDFVIAVRRQILKNGNRSLFSAADELKQVIDVLSYKAVKENIKIIFSPLRNDSVEVFGDAIKFNQIALNLIANAIDSYLENKKPDGGSHLKNREVIVSLSREKETIVLTVRDHGSGIPKENLNKIFEPFFTTKQSGMGIGLSMVKRIVEKDFNGTVKVASEANKGATFTVIIPQKQL
jgi:signal transduction histidine kinase